MKIRVASTRNWRSTSRRRAPTARRTPISCVRSRMLASMMFMMPMPPTRSEIDAIATMTISKIALRAFLLGKQLGGHHQGEIAGIAVRGIQDAADNACNDATVRGSLQLKI